MSDCYLDDDGFLSADFTVTEGVPEEAECAPQSLWIGVRPVYYGNEPSQEPMIQVCYQEAHMGGPLAGPVWITPAVWRELNAAVEWRLKERKRMHRGRKSGKKKCFNCGRRIWFYRGLLCRKCVRKDRKVDRDMRRNRRSKNAKLPGKR